MQRDLFGHAACALYAHCLIELTGVDAPNAARGTTPTVLIWVERHRHIFLNIRGNVLAFGDDDAAHFVTENCGIVGQEHRAAIRGEVSTAAANKARRDENLVIA